MGLSLAGVYSSRLRSLSELVAEEKACGFVAGDPANVFYYTGFRGGFLVVTEASSYLAVAPLDYLRAARRVSETGAPVEVGVFQPYQLPVGLELGGEPAFTGERLVGVLEKLVGRECRLLHDGGLPLGLYEELAKGYELVDKRSYVAEARMVKEPWEIERMRKAAEAGEEALWAALDELAEGVSEARLAGLVEAVMREAGAEDRAFPTIVAFGENSVYPHAEPSSRRRLRRGQVALFDLGAVYEGYCSDMTRTLVYGEAGPEERRVLEAVAEAVEAAIDAVEPGRRAEEVDAAARRVLERHRLDRYFIHSLGHGVGVVVHEEPRLSPGNTTALRPGMVVTIEPGVYIPGRFGVRIEELVLVTQRGARLLTSAPRLL